MPRIRIQMQELMDILTLPDTKEEMFEIYYHILKNGFLFNEFTLIIENTRTYKTKIKGYGDNQKIETKVIWHDNEGIAHNKKIETTIHEYLKELGEVINENAKIKNIFKWDVNKDSIDLLPVMSFMQYAITKAMNREYKEMPVTNKQYKPQKERSKSKPKEEYKLFDVIRKYERHINHNRHTIRCESWNVKGHFRHYKNGKVVYVKPYVKGKGVKKERNYKL